MLVARSVASVARHYRRRAPLRSAALVLLMTAMATAGCESPGPKPQPAGKRAPTEIDAASVPPRDDIISIHQLWPQFPWLYDSSGRAVGFRVPTYFYSGQTQEGAFVAGTIYCRMYLVERQPGGEEFRALLHEWEIAPQAAMGYRVRKRGVGGYFYGFMLAWPSELEIDGKLIEIEFTYQRLNGTVVSRSPHRLRVPVAPGHAPASSPGAR